MKLKWKIQAKETGRFASFHKRGWPSAYYENGEYAGGIISDENYSLRSVKEIDHGPLTLRFFDWSGEKPILMRSKLEYETLALAKEGLEKILLKNPHFVSQKKR